jgi:dipeptidyl aminopeptidase/acylaminoacyl peptidase
MKKLLLFQVTIFVYIFSFAQNGKQPVKVTDMLKIKTLGSLSLTDDGSKAAFTVLSIEPDGSKDYKYTSQIWTVAADGSSAPKQLTAKENASQPAWSPDGKRLAFVRAADGKAQIFLLSMDGGEAIQLTHFKYGASSPNWSPDGKYLLFTASIPLNDLLKDSTLNPGKEVPRWPFERPGFSDNKHLLSKAKPNPDGNLEEVRAYLEENAADRKATVLTKLNFQSETNISSQMSFNHIFITEARPGAIPRAVTRGFHSFGAAHFSPDGKRIIFMGDIDDTEHPDRSLESQIYSINTDGSDLKMILGEKGKRFFSPQISPSGKWLAFAHSTTSYANVPKFAIMPMDGAAKDIFNISFDRAAQSFTWSDDDKYLYFTAASNGGVPLYRLDIKTKNIEQLTDYNSGIGSYDLAGNRLVFVKTEVANPFEIYSSDITARNQKRISSFNFEWVQQRQLSFPEKKSFTNNIGQTIEYWVMKPVNFQPGKKFPMILNIHGGPAAMWGPGESSMWHEFQFWCSKGYGVVYCNPRGSGGYGEAFMRSNINDWGAGPTSDVLTALDKAVAEGWVDTSKLAVTGGSYAGYLVAYIIAHDKRFKAACSQRGVYDLATFFGEGNAWRLIPNYFGGYPWQTETKKILERESPITYVENITTPYIIFHGDNDRRTGFVQSEMLYRSLKVLGRPVEYVRHPNATHELTRSGDNRQRIDQMLRTWEFFERYISTATTY